MKRKGDGGVSEGNKRGLRKDGMVKENNGSCEAWQAEMVVKGRGEMYYPIKVHVSDAQPSI